MSAVKIIWIDDNYLYENFPLPERMSRASVLSVVQLEQFTTMQDMLGTCLYEHLEDAMYNQTLTVEEADLMKLVKYALAMYTAKSMITFMRSAASSHTNKEADVAQQYVLDTITSSIDAKASYVKDRIVYMITNTPNIYAIVTADGCDNDLFNNDTTEGAGGIYYPLGTGL